MKETQTKKHRKFFVFENNNVIVVGRKYFDDLKSREEALGIAVQVHLELQRQLQQDAGFGYNSRWGTIRLADGLNRSLQELEVRYPFILKAIHCMNLKNNGLRVAKA
ncbi:MAG TPA: hypothetical protein VJ201_00455 [Candidatus Babeliales bacterium]|nr:hypothetical protein [Candidatus Babeliales bacterium]